MIQSSKNTPPIHKESKYAEPENFLNKEFQKRLSADSIPARISESIFELLAKKAEKIQPLNISYLMTRLIEKMNLENLEKDPYFPLLNELVTLAQQKTTFDPIAACSYIHAITKMQTFSKKTFDNFKKNTLITIEKNISHMDEKNLSYLLNHIYKHKRIYENDNFFTTTLFFIIKEIQLNPEQLTANHLHQIFTGLSKLAEEIPDKSLLKDVSRILIKRTQEEIKNKQSFSKEALAQIFHVLNRLPVDYKNCTKQLCDIISYANRQYDYSYLKHADLQYNEDAVAKQMLIGINSLPDHLFFLFDQTKLLKALTNQIARLLNRDSKSFFNHPNLIFSERNLTDIIIELKKAKERLAPKKVFHNETINRLSETIERLENVKKEREIRAIKSPLPRPASEPSFEEPEKSATERPRSN